MNNLEEAFETCQLWFNHLERQERDSKTLQKAAALARAGQVHEARILKSQVDDSPRVFDGSTLLPAVKQLVEAAKLLHEIRPELERLIEARNKATEGEWVSEPCGSGDECWCRTIGVKGEEDTYVCPSGCINACDAEFIAEAANAIVSIAKKLERL